MQMRKCPACASEIGVMYDPHRGAHVPANEGDFGLCLHCYTILIFEGESGARVARQLEIDLMPAAPRAAMLGLQADLERDGLGGDRKDKHVRQAKPGEAGYARVVQTRPDFDWEGHVWKSKERYEADGGQFRVMTGAQQIAYASDPTKLALICDMARKGINVYMHGLEYEVFPPRSGLNHAFEIFPLTWEQAHFTVVLIPLAAKPEAERIAARYGMLVYDGIPMACRPKGVNAILMGNSRVGSKASQDFARRGRLSWFPIRGENAFSIENAPGCTPPEQHEEIALCNFIVSEWEARYPKQGG